MGFQDAPWIYLPASATVWLASGPWVHPIKEKRLLKRWFKKKKKEKRHEIWLWGHSYMSYTRGLKSIQIHQKPYLSWKAVLTFFREFVSRPELEFSPVRSGWLLIHNITLPRHLILLSVRGDGWNDRNKKIEYLYSVSFYLGLQVKLFATVSITISTGIQS